MIYIDKSSHQYFRGLARYVQELLLPQPSEITNDYSKEGTWILDYLSFRGGVHEKINGPYIVVQTEQFNVKGTPDYKKFLRGAQKIWDMEEDWKVGYADYWRLEMEDAKDIDVLFFGLLNDKRMRTLSDIPGLVTVRDYYGPDIMKYVMRSKIILSVHYYNEPMNDMARIAPLLSNKAFVIAEKTAEPWFNAQSDSIIIRQASEIKETVKYFLKNPIERLRWQDIGYEFVKTIKPSVKL